MNQYSSTVPIRWSKISQYPSSNPLRTIGIKAIRGLFTRVRGHNGCISW